MAARGTKTKFAWRLQVYTGKGRNCRPEVNQGKRAVLDLTESFSGHNITCGNFFTSMDLAMELKKNNLTMVGTIRRNKTFLPSIIFSSKSDSKYSSRFLYNENQQILLISYKPKNAKDVFILSSFRKISQSVLICRYSSVQIEE